jgi:hypothetical protein
MKKRIFMAIPLSLLLASCSIGGAKTTNTTENPIETTTEKQTTTKTTDGTDHKIIPEYTSSDIELLSPDFTTRQIPNQDSVTYEDLFNLGNEVSISIDMEDSELLKLQNDLNHYNETHNKTQLYRHCKSVTITLKNYDNTFSWTIEDVGIRQKGNTSRKEEWPIIENGQIASLNHFKLSFDETFDDEAYGIDKVDWSKDQAGYKLRKDREFLGLTGLDLKWNKNYDATHIKEVYASKLYKSLGLIIQNIGLTNFNINQIDKNQSYDMGVYTLYEPAKKSLIKRTLQNEDILTFGTWNDEKNGTYGVSGSKYGDLYKCSWGVDLTYSNMKNNIGIGSMDGSYVPKYERKTNTSETAYNDTLLLELGRAVAKNNLDDISQKLDIEYFAALEAVNYFVGNPDDLRNNTNNTMIYMRRSDGMGITIPIDNDRAFGITKDWNVRNGMTEVGPMDLTKAANGENVIGLYRNTILKKDSSAYKLYTAYLTALYNSDWLKDETFNELFNIAKNTYSASVSSDFDYMDFNLNDSNISFSNYIHAKKNLCKNYLDTNTNTEDDPITDTNGDYGAIYLVGSMNGWSGTSLPFTYNGDGEYTITFTPASVNNNSIDFKIYEGKDWKTIDWTIDLANNELIMEKGGNCTLSGVTTSSRITITINTITKVANIVIE